MARKFRKKILPSALLPLNHHERIKIGDLGDLAAPAHYPINRLGKTLMAIHARSSAPGKPVNGYYFDGYYHAGDTIYTPIIAEALKGLEVHTACLPIGGKYAVASPTEFAAHCRRNWRQASRSDALATIDGAGAV